MSARRLGVFLASCAFFLGLSCDEDDWSLVQGSYGLQYRYTAEREYRLRLEDGTERTYTLELASRGDKTSFHWSLLEFNGKEPHELTDRSERDHFDAMQAQFDAGGGYRLLQQVDFTVRDAALLEENYRVLHEASAGGSNDRTLTVLVLSRHTDRSHWRVTYSLAPTTRGLLLGFDEFRLESGREVILSQMRTRRLDVGVYDESFGTRRNDFALARTEIPSADDLADRAPFPVFLPRSLPVGFELIRIEEIELQSSAARPEGPGGSFGDGIVDVFRLVYTDGVECIDFFQHVPTAFSESFHDAPGQGGGGIGPSSLFVVKGQFMTVRFVSVPAGEMELSVEGRMGADRVEPFLKSLMRID